MVYLGTMENILTALEKINLVEAIPKNDYQLCGELSKEGFDFITDATFIGTRQIFERSKIYEKANFQFNENEFANQLVEKAGLPQARIVEKDGIEITFTGQQPLIKKICTDLNPEIAHKNLTRNIEISPVYLMIQTRNNIN